MSKPVLTRELAFAAAWDTGMRSMRAAGRKKWNQDDYNVAAAEYDRLWPVEDELKRSNHETQRGRSGKGMLTRL